MKTASRHSDEDGQRLEAPTTLNYHYKMFSVWMASPGGPESALGGQLMLPLIIFLVFYFIVMRPMKKKQQDTEAMLGALKNGDRVMTSGGIFGTVVGVTDDVIQLRIADSVKIQVAKSAVSQLVEEPSKVS